MTMWRMTSWKLEARRKTFSRETQRITTDMPGPRIVRIRIRSSKPVFTN